MRSPLSARRVLSDAEIQRLREETKLAPPNWITRLLRDDETRLEVVSENERRYLVWSSNKQYDRYSVGLVYLEEGLRYPLIRLCSPARRRHRNPLERVIIEAGERHQHMLTERYQEHFRSKPDKYAEVAPFVYNDRQQALDVLGRVANIRGWNEPYHNLTLWSQQ